MRHANFIASHKQTSKVELFYQKTGSPVNRLLVGTLIPENPG